MKIVAVQLKLRNCKSYKVFYDFLENDVFKNLPENCDLVVFPENINLSLFFLKNDFKSLNLRSFYERFIDWILSLLNLSFILKYEDLDYQKSVILSAFQDLAKKYNVNLITGSFYNNTPNGIYNSIFAVDRNGYLIGSGSKKDLVGLEKALKIKSKQENNVVSFDFGRVGLAVCFDLNDKDYIAKYKCDILVAPSNGWRLFPGYPFDPSTETPQIERAKENNFTIIRPYCAGWLGPLYFAGRSMIVDKIGNVINQSKTRNKSELLVSEIDI